MAGAVGEMRSEYPLELPFKDGRAQVIADNERAYLNECLRRFQRGFNSLVQRAG
jgi:hypothetical protein